VNLLLDTNVVSKWTKPRPDAGVVAWLAEADEDRIFISAITAAEPRHGIERLPARAWCNRLDTWLPEQVPQLIRRYGSRRASQQPTSIASMSRWTARVQSPGGV
jgi:predicted nucleic acid-binding protein